MSYVEFIAVFTFSNGGNRNQQWGGGGGCHFDVKSSILFIFAKILFRPRIVLSRLYL